MRKSFLQFFMDNKKKNIIGENIRAARKAKGLSQRELAQKLGVTSQNISNWETGFSKPTIKSLKFLAQDLDTTIDRLTTEGGFENEEESNTIGRNIRAARESAGLSQRQLAEKLDMGYQQLNKYELGLRIPGTKILSRIAGDLNISVDQFTDGIFTNTKSQTRFEIKSEEKQKELIREVLDKEPRLKLIEQYLEKVIGILEPATGGEKVKLPGRGL